MQEPCSRCPTFLIFKLKGCQACINMQSAIDQLKHMQRHGLFHVTEYDGMEKPQLAHVMRVSSFPTTLLFVPIIDPVLKKCTSFKIYKYEGPRNAEAMAQWVSKREYIKLEPHNIDRNWKEEWERLLRQQAQENVSTTGG